MDLCDLRTIRDLLGRHGFHFSKSMGQNFLIDASVPRDIAMSSGADESCGVLEIGPGIGPLTVQLSRLAGKVAAVELDRALLPVLEETLAECDNVQVISGDVLKLDLPALVREQFPGLTPLVCANLPYNITTPVLTALVESGCFSSLTVMIQREVARRICAAPGTADYGAFSVFMGIDVQYDLMLFFPVQIHPDLQHNIRQEHPLFPVRVRFHLHSVMDHRSFHIRYHIRRAPGTFHFSRKRNRIFQPLKTLTLIIALIQGKDKKFSPGPHHPVLRTEIQSPHFHRIPEKLSDIGLVGRQSDLLFFPQGIFFMYGQTEKPHRLLFYRYGIGVHRRGKTHARQFVHCRIKCHHRLDVQLAGMDQVKAEILDIPFQAHFVAVLNALQIQDFFYGEPGAETANMPLLFSNIQKIHV